MLQNIVIGWVIPRGDCESVINPHPQTNEWFFTYHITPPKFIWVNDSLVMKRKLVRFQLVAPLCARLMIGVEALLQT